MDVNYNSNYPYQQLFASRLRDLRRRQGLTQEQCAQRLGVSRQTLNYYEKEGGRMPDVDLLFRICSEFGVTFDYLLGPGNQPYYYPIQNNQQIVFSALASLGFSQNAINKILAWQNDPQQRFLHILSDFLCAEGLENLFLQLQSYTTTYSDYRLVPIRPGDFETPDDPPLPRLLQQLDYAGYSGVPTYKLPDYLLEGDLIPAFREVAKQLALGEYEKEYRSGMPD